MKRSYYESSARERLVGILDRASFHEFMPPSDRVRSPHLSQLDIPAAFDDGIVVGQGLIDGRRVLAASQEGGFMGGGVGEVHGAKLVGLLERALDQKPGAVLLLLDSGGVRLHEANAGLIAISEIMRAVLDVRSAGIPVLALNGGRCGCFGGMGVVARLCDAVIMNEEGRLGLSGPEVIETTCGVEEFDSRDRALVWRTVGGKHRYLLGEAEQLVADDIDSFRAQAIAHLNLVPDLSPAAIEREHAQLGERLVRFGACRDAIDIWSRLGIENPAGLHLLEAHEFLIAVAGKRA